MKPALIIWFSRVQFWVLGPCWVTQFSLIWKTLGILLTSKSPGIFGMISRFIESANNITGAWKGKVPCILCITSALQVPSVLWCCCLGSRKGIWPVKTEGRVLAWLSVWSKVQTCIWPSWCYCHSLSLASVKSRLVVPFWYQFIRVVPVRGPFMGCVCALYYHLVHWYWLHLIIMFGNCC